MKREHWSTRKKERIEYRWYVDGKYIGSRYYKEYVYQRLEGSEFQGLEYPTKVYRDANGMPFIIKRAWTAR